MQNNQRFGAIGRAWLGFLVVGACALHAEAVRAQGPQDKHHLRAQAGNQFHADNEENHLDGHAEALWQDGVGGVNPSFFIHHAVADGDSGVLSISSTFSLAGGAGDPIFVSGNNASSASIEESIDPGDVPTGPVIVTARLTWGGSGSLTSPGDTDGGSIRAGLVVNNCQVGFRQRFYSDPSIPVPGEPTVGCGSTFYVTGIGDASAGLLTATQIIDDPEAIPTRFYVTASISGEVNPASSLEYFDSGQYEASGQLTIEVSGVDFTYSSPTFLTVPEPGGAALAAMALAALAVLARRRTSVRARAWLGLLLVGAYALHAQAVHAQTTQDKHHLLASGRAGNQVQGDVEVDRFDGHAEAVLQGGVQGVNPSFFFHEAMADGDAGALSIFSVFSLAGPDLDPLSRSDHHTVALIEESVDPEFLSSGPVTFTAQLDWDGSGSPNDGNGEPNSASVSAGLRVNMCSVGFEKTFYSTGFGESTPTESCSNTAHVTNTTAAGAGLLSITQTMDGSALPTRFYVTAQIEGEASYFGPDDGAEYEASGTLSIEVTGVGYSFSSPTFLTVPEPGGAALAVTGIASLARLARRRRAR